MLYLVMSLKGQKKDGSTYENPFMDAVGVLFDEKYAGKNVAIGHPTKDPSYGYKRFEKIASYSKPAKPLMANLVKVTPADTTDGLSATDLRNAVDKTK